MSREQGNSAVNTKMDQDFFKYLPSEIILDILLRLPIRAIMICKFVCKPWLDLLKTPEFIKCHLSRSAPGLAVYELEGYLKPYRIFEFVDDVNLNCRWNKVFSFHLPYNYAAPHGSANGLLYSAVNTKMDQDFFKCLPSEIILDILLRLPIRAIVICKFVCKPWLDLLKTPEFIKCHLSRSAPGLAVYELEGYLKPYRIFEFVDDVNLNCRWNKVFSFHLPYNYAAPHGSANGLLYLQGHCLCNPITREYIMLPPAPAPGPRAQFLSSGFGVSKMTGQYKVVRVLIRRSQPAWVSRGIEYQIYTVGTGLWRWIDFDAPFSFDENETEGVFLNGNLHWLAYKGSISVSCLDLETESSSSCAAPLLDFDKCRSLSVLRDCLCLCDNSEFSMGAAYEIDIWLMKAYGEKLWTKEFVIRKIHLYQYIGYLFPFKIFEDGNILMEHEGNLLYYSSKNKTIQEAGDMFGLESDGFSCPTVFTPSFLSLETFAMEDVTSF